MTKEEFAKPANTVIEPLSGGGGTTLNSSLTAESTRANRSQDKNSSLSVGRYKANRRIYESCESVCRAGLGRGFSGYRKIAFTLAEVLITIGVIGVVAALTIPTLMKNINKKVVATQKEVMEQKIVQGLNSLSHEENGLNVTYANTEEFVKALARHMKIITICGKDNLTDCMAYDKIGYDSNGETKTVDVSSITSASKMKLKGDNWLEPAGFVMATGTPFIISYNNDCGGLTDEETGRTIVDPDRPLKSIPTACIDGVYDNNGTRSPNKFNTDVQPLANAKIGASCLLEVGGKCLVSTAPVVPTPMTKADCAANKSTYGINGCNSDPDYWSGAVKACKDQGMCLPTEAELTELAKYLYNDSSITTSNKSGLTLDTSKLPDSFSGLGTSWYYLWSSAKCSSYSAYARYFNASATERANYGRNFSYIRFICVGE